MVGGRVSLYKKATLECGAVVMGKFWLLIFLFLFVLGWGLYDESVLTEYRHAFSCY